MFKYIIRFTYPFININRNIIIKYKYIYLDCNINDSFTDDLLVSLTFSRNIQYINFSNNNITDVTITYLNKYIATWENLEYLNVSDNQITDECFEDLGSQLQFLPKLKIMDLHSNMIYDINNIFCSSYIYSSLKELYLNSIYILYR